MVGQLWWCSFGGVVVVCGCAVWLWRCGRSVWLWRFGRGDYGDNGELCYHSCGDCIIQVVLSMV